MSQNNDNGELLFIGGIVTVVLVIGFLIKILKTIMIELSALFLAIGKMAAAFISMAWQITQVLGLLSLGILAIYESVTSICKCENLLSICILTSVASFTSW